MGEEGQGEACAAAHVRPAGLHAARPWCLRSRSAQHGNGHAAQPPRTGSSCPSAPLQSCPLAGAHSRRGPFACCLVRPQCQPRDPAQLLLALSHTKQSVRAHVPTATDHSPLLTHHCSSIVVCPVSMCLSLCLCLSVAMSCAGRWTPPPPCNPPNMTVHCLLATHTGSRIFTNRCNATGKL